MRELDGDRYAKGREELDIPHSHSIGAVRAGRNGSIGPFAAPRGPLETIGTWRDPVGMGDRPAGTVTFLFSDVEGSTAHLRELGEDAYAAELDAHRRTLRRCWLEHDGYEIDTQGDSFFVAFGTAWQALAAARAVQSALAGRSIRARIGIHTGEPLLTDEGYVGMDVHRAARIAAAGHGGQILMSQTTRDLVDEADLVALGEFRLKDMTQPERLHQVGTETFPPLRNLNASQLPLAAHPLVGRRTEQAELASLLREHRLVSITGTGGTGKTRLALQVAAEVGDGARWVSLAGMTDPASVLPAAIEALGVARAEDAREVPALLVLDNFEHLLAAAPDVGELVAGPTGPTVLVTSRHPLQLSMEREYPLDPLPEAEAVELFLDRARPVRRDLRPTDDVRELCRALDGLPLALELAAARLKLLDPSLLLQRLDSRLSLLTRGPRDAPERQRTLEATIAWSFDLLDAPAQKLLVELSVFAGVFDLDAVEHVLDAELDDLHALVDASLVKSRGNGRFLMLETMRAFAHDRLVDDEQLRARHAEHFLELAHAAEPHLTGPEAADWFDVLDVDYGNFRAALDWLGTHSPDGLVDLATALWRYWLTRGRYEEGETVIERALATGPEGARRAELLYRLGAIVISRGRTAEARTIFDHALDGFRQAGEAAGEARALNALGHVAADAGDWNEAIRLYELAAARFREAGDAYLLAGVLGDLATVHLRAGSPVASRALAVESAQLQRTVGNRQGESLALATQGYGDLEAGDLAAAERALRKSTAIARELGYLHGLVFSLNGLAAVTARRGDADRAAELFRTARALRRHLRIEHDPDDQLVAAHRAALGSEPEQEAGGEVDVDRLLAAVLD